jgi:CRP-like cAMP-binding protein
MTISMSFSPQMVDFTTHKFTRRSQLPLKQDYLWQIETGVVRTLTCLEDGTNVTLGLWGPGDVVSRVLSKANPYQIECLTAVEASVLPLDRWHLVNEAIILHVHQFQEFLEILHCRSVDASLLQFFTWMAKKFGQQVERGSLLELHLTHQEISEIIGTTRVTVTRLLNTFEKQGLIKRFPRKFMVMHEKQPFWHYEI